MWTKTMDHFYLVLLLLSSTSFIIVSGMNMNSNMGSFDCPFGEHVTFEKQIGIGLANGSIYQDSLFFVRAGEDGALDWTPLPCVKRCLEIPSCKSVVVNHLRQECVGLTRVETRSLLVDNDASYFVKICAAIPEECKTKLWALESISGSRLVGENSIMRIADGLTEDECSRTLLRSSLDINPARSAQFIPQRSTSTNSEHGYNFYNNDINNMMPPQLQETPRGRCIVNRENKHTQPESYRVANSEVVYKENQCAEDFPKHIDRCSYEEYSNYTLKHFDAIIYSTTTSQCKKLCEDEDQFNCRGFTVIPESTYSQYYMTTGSTQELKTCLLHSEDTLTLGSWILSKRTGAMYFRRVMCLDISVECSPISMTITYNPHSDFKGRMYVSGYSETCSSPGLGFGHPTTLVVPYHSDRCAVNKAFAYEDSYSNTQNTTLMYTLLVIQNNPIIQAQGDRFVRVGCVQSPSYNLTLDTSIHVGVQSENQTDISSPGDPSSFPASSIINSTGIAGTPRVKMYIVNEPDERDQAAAFFPGGAVSLGESIELRIEADVDEEESIDIHAYHLVASSQLGDSSVLLLDGRGCPTGQVDFPVFKRTKLPRTVRLSSRFRAFRFPNSHVVKFSVMVQFCANTCGEIVCQTLPETPVYSPNRQTRSLNNTERMGQMESHIVWSSEVEDLNMPYENATVKFAGSVSETRTKSGKVVVASSDNIMRMREVCHEIYEGNDKKVPLELSLVVASNEVAGADSLIYGESSNIVMAGTEDFRSNPSMICIHEGLFITMAFVWLFVQIIILVGCLVVIKKYRNFAEDSRVQKDYHSFDNLGFESFTTNRRVHWPDQNVDILHVT